jgi:hypothetical protein
MHKGGNTYKILVENIFARSHFGDIGTVDGRVILK